MTDPTASTAPATLPYDVVRRLESSHPTAPRLTWYGPEAGERIEISGRVLGNWVNKAANLLRDDLDADEGTVVRLTLPTGHWRALYWALATWAVGGTVSLTGEAADIVVSAHGEESGSSGAPVAPGAAQVVVSLPVLGRPGRALPSGALDESSTLPAQPDDFVPFATPARTTPALLGASATWSFGEVVPLVDQSEPETVSRQAGRVALATDGDPAALLRSCLAVWSTGGSIVIVPADHPRRADILLSEGVATAD